MSYDKYYQTENLFGDAYPELLDFFREIKSKGKILDLGCGQGRDAIALARLGINLVGVDNSKIGINQMNEVSKRENLLLTGLVSDIYKFDDVTGYDFVVLDSMFHFAKKDKQKEIQFIQSLMAKVDETCKLVICIQDSGQKVKILKKIIDSVAGFSVLVDKQFQYTFEDQEIGHKSTSDYKMMVIGRL